MMTLDEAIAHAKELSENQSICEDCREEHKQLATWLEELKQYKDKECEISAREMFEVLGYMRFKEGNTVLYFNDSEEEEYKSIKFNRKKFTFEAVTNYNEPFSIDLALFDAIQTQMREWRWI